MSAAFVFPFCCVFLKAAYFFRHLMCLAAALGVRHGEESVGLAEVAVLAVLALDVLRVPEREDADGGVGAVLLVSGQTGLSHLGNSGKSTVTRRVKHVPCIH